MFTLNAKNVQKLFFFCKTKGIHFDPMSLIKLCINITIGKAKMNSWDEHLSPDFIPVGLPLCQETRKQVKGQ